MQQFIHPTYNLVIFRDAASGSSFLTKSTKTSNASALWTDGQTYPVIDVEISSASHAFFTGKEKRVDTAGRIDRFNRRYSA